MKNKSVKFVMNGFNTRCKIVSSYGHSDWYNVQWLFANPLKIIIGYIVPETVHGKKEPVICKIITNNEQILEKMCKMN